jgi:hypothetical protein
MLSMDVLLGFQPTDYGNMHTGDSGGGGMAMIMQLVFFLIFGLPVIAGFWKIFAKAGQPGWAILIPIYNSYIFTKVAGKAAWWTILLLIPGIGAIAAFIVLIDIARKFGKGTGFGIGLWFVPFICAPMLGFGSAQYNANA